MASLIHSSAPNMAMARAARDPLLGHPKRLGKAGGKREGVHIQRVGAGFRLTQNFMSRRTPGTTTKSSPRLLAGSKTSCRSGVIEIALAISTR